MSVLDPIPLSTTDISDAIDRAVHHHTTRPAIAVIGADGTPTRELTYGEFGAVVAQLRDELTRTGDGAFVGVDATRGAAPIIGIAAALAAHRPFVVLDRRDSSSTNREKVSLLGVGEIIAAGDDGTPALEPVPPAWAATAAPTMTDARPTTDAPRSAYAIYTSGSTGHPKCVLVGRDALGAVIADHVTRLEVDEWSRTLQFARLTFDGCLTEILWTLTAGACLVVTDESALTPGPVLQETLRAQGITHLKSTPFALTATEADEHLHLERVVNGGGACRPDTVARWSAVAQFHNAYGLTEASICSLLSAPLAPEDCAPAAPLGEPVGGAVVEIAGPDARGELVVTGPAVAHGYLTQDGLRPFQDADGVPRYRSGDLVERRDGQLYFIERLDRQVKIRGYRLDPGEIENAVCAHPGVREATVLPGPVTGEQDPEALVCFFTGDTDSRSLRTHLEDTLDPYKVPTTLSLLDELPYTPNGKVDHRALIEHVDPGASDGDPVQGLLELVRRLTGDDRASLEDNFFDLGGDSGTTIVLVNELRGWGWVDAGVRDVLRAATLGDLADALAERSA